MLFFFILAFIRISSLYPWLFCHHVFYLLLLNLLLSAYLAFLGPLLKPSPHTNDDFELGFPLQQECYLPLNVDHFLFYQTLVSIVVIWSCFTNLGDQIPNNYVCIVLITKSFQVFQNPSLFPTHHGIHSLSSRITSDLQQRSVCMPVSGLVPLMSSSYFILFYKTLAWTPGQQRNKKIEMFCSLPPRLVARRQLEASDIRPHFYPPPPPTPKSNYLFNDFSNREHGKKYCPQQTDLSGTGTVMQFFWPFFSFPIDAMT